MGNVSNYSLILGVKLNLKPQVLREVRGGKLALADVPYDEYLDMVQDRVDRSGLITGYVLPDGKIVENLENEGAFAYPWNCKPNKLCFIKDDDYLGDVQLLGIALLHHSTDPGYAKASSKRLLKALGRRPEISHKINKHGFRFTTNDVDLHQYLMREH